METECEPKFFDLDPPLKPNLTPVPLLNLSHISELVLVPISFTPEPKSTISPNPHSIFGPDVG